MAHQAFAQTIWGTLIDFPRHKPFTISARSFLDKQLNTVIDSLSVFICHWKKLISDNTLTALNVTLTFNISSIQCWTETRWKQVFESCRWRRFLPIYIHLITAVHGLDQTKKHFTAEYESVDSSIWRRSRLRHEILLRKSFCWHLKRFWFSAKSPKSVCSKLKNRNTFATGSIGVMITVMVWVRCVYPTNTAKNTKNVHQTTNSFLILCNFACPER